MFTSITWSETSNTFNARARRERGCRVQGVQGSSASEVGKLQIAKLSYLCRKLRFRRNGAFKLVPITGDPPHRTRISRQSVAFAFVRGVLWVLSHYTSALASEIRVRRRSQIRLELAYSVEICLKLFIVWCLMYRKFR